NGLFDHPVARTSAPAQPTIVALDRPVATAPDGTGFDQGPELPLANGVRAVAIPWVRPPLEPDVHRDPGRLGRLGDQLITAFQGQSQGLLGVKVFSHPDRVAINGIVGVARDGGDDGVDVRPIKDRPWVIMSLGPLTARFLDNSLAALTVLALEI